MEKFNKKFSDYYEYLDEIWKKLRNLVIVFSIFFVVGFFSCGQILKFIVGSFNLEDVTVVTTSPFQFFDLAMSIGVYTGLIACVPLFLYNIYNFLKNGLNDDEKKSLFILLPIGLLLFCAGFAYGAIVLGIALDSVATINLGIGIENFWDINNFLSQVILTSILLGVIFQFPIVLSFLVKRNLLSVNLLRNKRRHVIVAIFVVTSILPPTDGFSLIVMVIPLIIIYEITILINSAYSTSRIPIAETA